MRKPSADAIERLAERLAGRRTDFPGAPHFVVVSVGDLYPSRLRDLFLHGPAIVQAPNGPVTRNQDEVIR